MSWDWWTFPFLHFLQSIDSPLSHVLSSVVKTACNGPANNALFVPDKERKKPDAVGQEKGIKHF